MEILLKYFPNLTDAQIDSYAKLKGIYEEWNAKINVISRKDVDNFYIHHVLHSLGIAKVQLFKPGAEILDLGTGGGFPGIPLAIMFPDTHFLLADSIGKKITVVNAVIEELGLANAQGLNKRAEQIHEYFDFVVTRAVAPMGELHNWVKHSINRNYNHELKNGILALKGGDLKDELQEANRKTRTFNLSNYFTEDYFETKKVIHLPMV